MSDKAAKEIAQAIFYGLLLIALATCTSDTETNTCQKEQQVIGMAN